MSITLLIYLLVPKSILSINFVPNIGNGVIDPIPSSDSSDGYLENDKEVIFKRKSLKNIAREAIDYEKCVEIGDRILCGYEKNKGLQDVGKIVDLGNGCRIRGDRMECNYNTPTNYNNDPVNNKHYRAMRQRPTRTPKPAISRRDRNLDSDIHENKILKSTFDKFLTKSETTQNMVKSTVLIDPTFTTKETTEKGSTATETVTSSTPKTSQSTKTVTQSTQVPTQSTETVTQTIEASTQSKKTGTRSAKAATQSSKTRSSTAVNQSTGTFTENLKGVSQTTTLFTHRTKPIHNKTTTVTLSSHADLSKMYEDPELNDISADEIIFRRAIAKTPKLLPILRRIVTNQKPNLLTAENYEIVVTETATRRAKTVTQNAKAVAQSNETVTQNAKAVNKSSKKVTQNAKPITQSTRKVTQNTKAVTQTTNNVTQSTKLLTHKTKPIHNKRTEKSHVDLSKMNEDSILNDILPDRKIYKREIATSKTENYEDITNNMNLRQSNSENVTTSCVENEDTIVCYNFIT